MNHASDPRIAVLIPSYNPGAELALSLDTLRQQTVPHRVILVDDGSARPADYETLMTGMDAQIIRLAKNQGITGALNAGLAYILKHQFEFVARLDVGDFCTPDRFAKQIAFLDGHPDVGIVGSAVEFRLYDKQNKLFGSKVLAFPLTPDAAAKRLRLNAPIIHPAMLIRTEVFRVLKTYSDAYPAAEDYDLLWRAHRSGFKLTNLKETLLIKEETPDSISQSRRRRQLASRLHLQWINRDLLDATCWLGFAKSLVTWALPAWAVHSLKYLAGR